MTDSTVPIFSYRLMMFHISLMIAAGIGHYGLAIGASPRMDIAGRYASLLPEIFLYAEDGADILIKHGWIEQPPEANNRNQLAR